MFWGFRIGNKLHKAIAANEGVLNSNKLQKIFKKQGIIYIVTKTHVNQVKKKICTIKKLIGNKLRANKNKIWVEILRSLLNKYNI